MGIDGSNYLQVRGPELDIASLAASLLVIENPDSVCKWGQSIVTNLLGPKNVKIAHRSPNYITFNYPFRNGPIYDYLKQLLIEHPKCWFKNEYITEDGNAGLWIARMGPTEPSIQELEWSELSEDSIRDFSSE
jgi:hypothetical protein